MPIVDDLVERIRKGDPLPPLVGPLLSSAAPLVRVGMWLRLRGPFVRVPAHVVSYGNITTGGTGKTPAVIERARRELAAGRRVAVLTRGYGAAKLSAPLVVTANERNPGRLAALADEPRLIRQSVPGVVIAQHPDRVASAQRAVFDHGCDLLILDDGYQYVRLARDENICLIDARNPFGTGRLLPRGLLREPVRALARATRFIVTRCDQAQDVAGLLEQLSALCPETPVQTTRHAPQRLRHVSTGEILALDMLREQPVIAASGIGSPEAFEDTLASLGAEIAERRRYRDHASIPFEELTGRGRVVTTEKDAARAGQLPDNVYCLEVRLEDWTPPE